MLYREHLIELYVNGEKVELEDQKSLNLRLNNVLLDPTKVSNTQADYSFSFDIPSTPRNDRIFDYANNLAKENKFHTRWNADVYADGMAIFKGSLTINSYKEKKYNCNLVNVKTYSLEDIFGDAVLSDIEWYVPFSGANDINYYNMERSKEVSFPLVSYGVFQKTPEDSDEIGNTYTSKFDIDKYNKWWIESFYPSMNMMETLRKAFEWKGYKVGGDAFDDENISEIFMSTNLGSEQIPIYNLGHPRFGRVNLTTTYTVNTQQIPYEQELNFPYFRVFNPRGQFTGQLMNTNESEAWNYNAIRLYDLLEKGSTVIDDTYMYDPNEKCIVIPADGFYKIELEVNCTLNDANTNITFGQNVITNNGSGNDIEVKDVTMPRTLLESTPLEIHLVRNYDDNIELIKGKNNKEYVNGNPTQATNFNNTSNINTWQTCFPHQDAYNSWLPTKKNDLTTKAESYSRYGNFGGSSVNNPQTEEGGGSTIGGSRSGSGTTGGGFGGRRQIPSSQPTRDYTSSNMGYVYKDGDIMAFDQAVTDTFICGFSSFLGGTPAVMKNGYSWSKSSSLENNAFYINNGYNKIINQNGSETYSATTYNQNTYPDAPSVTFSCSNGSMVGKLCCMVKLLKNDILELFAIHRALNNSAGTIVNYSTTNQVKLKIEAASPNSYAFLKTNGFGYNNPSEFDYDLRLSNFLSNETTITSFIQGCTDAFNLQLRQDGNNIWIDTKKNAERYNGYAVNIDDRTSSYEAESSIIDYPKSMAIKYKIDEDEWGFERSVTPQSMLNQPDWKDYADYGYSTIELNDDAYVTNTSEKTIPFSYTWYDTFNFYYTDSANTQTSTSIPLRMPVISHFEYMIDGYNYDEAMRQDGYSLAQRFWYRPTLTTASIWTDSKPTERVYIYLPSNTNGVLNLSYKTTENSLLRYFNTSAYLASNYVTVEVYLNPMEYNDLKNGAMVWFDRDLYLVAEIQGYDPTGYNKTTLKLIKKVN